MRGIMVFPPCPTDKNNEFVVIRNPWLNCFLRVWSLCTAGLADKFYLFHLDDIRGESCRWSSRPAAPRAGSGGLGLVDRSSRESRSAWRSTETERNTNGAWDGVTDGGGFCENQMPGGVEGRAPKWKSPQLRSVPSDGDLMDCVGVSKVCTGGLVSIGYGAFFIYYRHI